MSVRSSLAAAVLALLLALGSAPPAQADDLAFGYVPAPGPGEQPALLVTPARTVTRMEVEVQAVLVICRMFLMAFINKYLGFQT